LCVLNEALSALDVLVQCLKLINRPICYLTCGPSFLKTSSSVACVEFALQPQHETPLDSGIQTKKDFNNFKKSQESDPEVYPWFH